MKRIYDSLSRILERHRIVFWYDPNDEWGDTFETFPAEGVVKLRVTNDEFATKVRITRAPDNRFLLYVPGPRPPDTANWLLDLLLQGHEYRADRISLALQEVGLPQDFRELAEKHVAFFNSAKRIMALRELLNPEDEPRSVRLKMMGILAGSSADVDALLLHFLGRGAEAELVDPVVASLDGAGLSEPFWAEVRRLFGYATTSPSLRDFAVSLFRGANPLDRQVTLHPHARVFLQRWKDSQAHSESFRAWAAAMESELQIPSALSSAGDRLDLGDWDTFEVFEKFTLHRLAQAFERSAPTSELRAVIKQRRASFWVPQHSAGYAALDSAITLRELLEGADLTVESLPVGVHRYTNSWWRIDTAYRRCIYHLRCYGQIQVMEPVSGWIEKSYVNNFLLPLSDQWSDQVRRLQAWECEGLRPQRRFFESYVQPFLAKQQKLFVIVSDALRYEAAAEFAELLCSTNRWTAQVEALFGSLPSYTQLGMASLLPGKVWTVDPVSMYVSVDGRSAVGTPNRAQILALASGGRATALQAEEFLELNTKTDGRVLMRDHDVIYIFHNHIDKVGDETSTEAKTFDAVAQTFQQLDQLIRKVANINGTNMLLTADHGFLFQQDPVADEDMLPLPAANEVNCRNRRFVIARSIAPSEAIKVFSSRNLGFGGDWSAAFPLSLKRFRVPGSGRRYVHGGVSLQEIVVPVVRIHKARSDDTRRVEVDALRIPQKITTGQLSLTLFQDAPALEKAIPRTLHIAVFAKDGIAISEKKTVIFDSKESDPRLRETTIVLVLSAAADNYNDQEVELRLEETMFGTNQQVTYRAYDIKLQKAFMSDFDEL